MNWINFTQSNGRQNMAIMHSAFQYILWKYILWYANKNTKVNKKLQFYFFVSYYAFCVPQCYLTPSWIHPNPERIRWTAHSVILTRCCVAPGGGNWDLWGWLGIPRTPIWKITLLVFGLCSLDKDPAQTRYDGLKG